MGIFAKRPQPPDANLDLLMAKIDENRAVWAVITSIGGLKRFPSSLLLDIIEMKEFIDRLCGIW